MYKKAETILEKYDIKLVEKKRFLTKRYTNKQVIESEIDQEIELISKELLNVRMQDLERILYNLKQELSELLKENDKFIDEIELIEVQLKLLERTISNKQIYHKYYTHLVDRNIISHGFFSTSSPNKENIVRTTDGSIEFTRSGLKKLHYRNNKGAVLTTYDTRILIGLFKQWEIKGKNPTFTVKFNEIIKAMNRDLNGGEYMAIGKSIDKISSTSIVMEKYSSPNNPKKRTSIFNPIQSTLGYPENNCRKITFSDYLQNSLIAGNYITISMSLFNDLKLSTSKTLYINVIKMFSENTTIAEINPFIEHLGLHSYSSYKALQSIKKACQELIDFDVLKSYTIEKRNRTPYKIHFFPSEWVQKMAIKENKRLLPLFKCDKKRYII
ncbi:replication initiator protein A [Salicibibacter cibarius]|uniref:Replication initiator protein A n=1 Tax=Salicibibacter cibarius TaxID=2743000 RepID=A0A7T6Z698_9BACI|nr:replication initiator protein A [Salicibibacter cibarius]QQK77760.1 replication initiator protein A [Salicibibacter cibarius]